MLSERYSEKTPTAATVSSQRTGVWVKDTMNILAQMEFFEGFRAWCAMPAQLEWRRTA